MQYNFEWDPRKARDNHRRHGVRFEQAATVLGDPRALSVYDAGHSAHSRSRRTGTPSVSESKRSTRRPTHPSSADLSMCHLHLTIERGYSERYDDSPNRALQRTANRSRSARRSVPKEMAMDLVFEWDEDNARSNEAKHGVAFHEGKTVFNDPFAVTIPDPDHSEYEDRWIDIGFSSKGRLVVVGYSERNDRIRIIGCRMATPGEQRRYGDERTG